MDVCTNCKHYESNHCSCHAMRVDPFAGACADFAHIPGKYGYKESIPACCAGCVDLQVIDGDFACTRDGVEHPANIFRRARKCGGDGYSDTVEIPEVPPEKFVGWGATVVISLVMTAVSFLFCFFAGQFHTRDDVLPVIFIGAAVWPLIGGFVHGIRKSAQTSFAALHGVAIAANLFLVTWEADVRHPEYVIMAVLFAFIGFWVAAGLHLFGSWMSNKLFKVDHLTDEWGGWTST